MDIPTDLSRLWQLAGDDSRDPGGDWIGTFEPVGLILDAAPKNGGYWCTPRNSVAFAWTGGDGVHYSFVNLPGASIDLAPVVMTVPMADQTNVIVGANLREFLCLGCRFGYFALEQLVYDFDNTVDAISGGAFHRDATDEERSLLERLSDAFALTPWDDPSERLEALEDQYRHMLDIPAPPDA